MAPGGRALSELRLGAWKVRKALKRNVGNWMPSWSVRGGTIGLSELREAWPPVKAVFPQPHVLQPPAELQPLFDTNPFYAGRPVVLPPHNLHAIENGLLAPRSGLIGTRDGTWVLESAKNNTALRWAEEFQGLRLPVVDHPGEGWVSTVMNATQQRSFGHWLVDAVPRIYALGALGEPVELLVPDTLHKNFQRFLELVCPANVTIRVGKFPRVIRAKNLLLSPFVTPSGCGVLRPLVLETLRSNATQKAKSNGEFPRRIYISRERAQWSRVENEAPLRDEMVKLGLTSMVLESLSADDQVALFSKAELVVAPLTSGFANVLWARPGLKVVEIFSGGPAGGMRPHLYNAGLAVACGHQYVPVFHANENSEPSYRVDVEKIAATVRPLVS
ncbi:MAG: glycosyltransferase 61 family protein [Myxococcaceae bacterium]